MVASQVVALGKTTSATHMGPTPTQHSFYYTGHILLRRICPGCSLEQHHRHIFLAFEGRLDAFVGSEHPDSIL